MDSGKPSTRQNTKYEIRDTQQLPALLVIVGETASGKSGLAMEAARKFNGELICADSRTVYKGMNVGTAKPSLQDQAEIPHHLLDVVEPDERFSAGMFKELALKAIDDIAARGKLPILVGGTGLYIDAVILDYQFDHKTKGELRENTLVIGLKPNRTELRRRIEARVEQMFRAGLRKEVEELASKYGWDHWSMTGIGYREFKDYEDKKKSMTQVKQAIARNTQVILAKHQRTWFKRHIFIEWFEDPKLAVSRVEDWL